MGKGEFGGNAQCLLKSAYVCQQDNLKYVYSKYVTKVNISFVSTIQLMVEYAWIRIYAPLLTSAA